MDYTPQEIEAKWQAQWKKDSTYKVETNSPKPKFYVLDMFPYPSGSGLHVGHPLGYIASDIYARYKRMNGFNVLHPMGYDAFGLPAEQYAISRGVHPAKSTDENILRYRAQLDALGLSFDWDREVKTSDSDYYKWTQTIFLMLFGHYCDNKSHKARPIEDLVAHFEKEGTVGANAYTSNELSFTNEEWKAFLNKKKDDILMEYRLAYRNTSFVNWCEELGTVLANDEVVNGVSERGGYPVIQKQMMQWKLRITAYAERMLNELEALDWSESLKIQQRNWIGRSEGAKVFFQIDGSDKKLEVFTTRPDTVFGVTFMVVAPEHDWVDGLTSEAQKEEIQAYKKYVSSRSEIERQQDKAVTGAFTGSYCKHPFTGKNIPIYISEYVLAGYGTGAIMAVPSDDERDQKFATKFGIEIIDVVDKSDYPNATLNDKIGKIINSDFMNGMEVKEAIVAAIAKLEEKGIGEGQINYKLRDANYSRQRYWGEPIPIKYDAEGVAHPLNAEELPLLLPEMDDFSSHQGKGPLAKLEDWMKTEDGMTREPDTMPGFAGSSWYFLRYMDARNNEEMFSEEAVNYWKDVDLYIGGTEHAVGHLMYSRFWHKFLFDKGIVPTNEPFKKLINQGMIQGRSNIVYRANEKFAEYAISKILKEKGFVFQSEYPIAHLNVDFAFTEHKVAVELKSARELRHLIDNSQADFEKEGWKILGLPLENLGKWKIEGVIARIEAALNGEIDNNFPEDLPQHPFFISKDMVKDDTLVTALHVDVNIVENDFLDIEAFKKWLPENERAGFWLNENGQYLCGHQVEKMSKRYYNVVNPDDMSGKYGVDCFRMYEMFLGPLTQSKPWDTNGISGVSGFLKKFWSLFFKEDNFVVSDEEPTKEMLKIVHTCIKKVNYDVERFSFNTCVSHFMSCVNDLRKLKCNNRQVLTDLVKLLAPLAPHIAEELWSKLGQEASVTQADYPKHNEAFLKEDSIEYPISINGKKRATASFSADASKDEIEKAALALEIVQKWTEGKTVAKVIVVPKRMVNIVVKG